MERRRTGRSTSLLLARQRIVRDDSDAMPYGSSSRTFLRSERWVSEVHSSRHSGLQASFARSEPGIAQ
eukprot:995764-Rhodomonas_salina.1